MHALRSCAAVRSALPLYLPLNNVHSSSSMLLSCLAVLIHPPLLLPSSVMMGVPGSPLDMMYCMAANVGCNNACPTTWMTCVLGDTV